MPWQTERFGSAHEGVPGAVLDDGTEPEPVIIDVGSAATIHETTDWRVYDGEWGRPRAAYLRGACSCGWRGDDRYPIDWDVDRRDHDDSGPYEDWERHIEDVESRSIPLPTELDGLIEHLEELLLRLTDDAPVAAVKAVGILEAILVRVGRAASAAAQRDDPSWAAIATALGVTEKQARSRLLGYSLRHRFD
jgi:hypothetical protein